jgi:tetratricopeptide (TPR) repeat protein
MTDHADRAINLNNIGMAASHRGDYVKAMKYFEDALAEMKQASGDKENSPHYLDFLKIKDDLGYAHLQLGDLDKALEYCKAATEAAEKRYGRTHPEMGTFYSNLGLVYFQKKNLAFAESCFQKALAVNRLHHPHDHPDIARDLCNLASIIDKRGDHQGARKALEEALAIEEKTLGPDHPTLITTYKFLGGVLINEMNLSVARQYFQKAYDLAQRINHPETVGLSEILAQFDRPSPAPPDKLGEVPIIFSDSVYIKGIGKVLLGMNTALVLMQFIKTADLNEAEGLIRKHPDLHKPIIDTKMQQLAQEQVHPLAKRRIEERHALLSRARNK